MNEHLCCAVVTVLLSLLVQELFVGADVLVGIVTFFLPKELLVVVTLNWLNSVELFSLRGVVAVSAHTDAWLAAEHHWDADGRKDEQEFRDEDLVWHEDEGTSIWVVGAWLATGQDVVDHHGDNGWSKLDFLNLDWVAGVCLH
jgi:hypothetical protein